MINTDIHNETFTAKAFSKQAVLFDELYANNAIVHYKRERVRAHVLNYLNENNSMLELNSGTGDDAIFFAQHNIRVHATDISEGMQNALCKKLKASSLNEFVSNEICTFTNLESLQNKGPFNYIFSNFAGLNCTNNLKKVIDSLPPLLKENGFVTFVILPKFCLWEFLLFLKGKTKTAFRRFFSKNGRKARVEDEYFYCWYYNPSEIIKMAGSNFKAVKIEGLCTLVPPSYIEGFAEKYPRAFKLLKSLESKLKTFWPWRSIGDYFIITLQNK